MPHLEDIDLESGIDVFRIRGDATKTDGYPSPRFGEQHFRRASFTFAAALYDADLPLI
jgi:hypothetical protein